MKVVGLKILKDFADRHAEVRAQIEAWFWEAEEAEWKTPQGLKRRYPNASILSGDRVVFDLKGKKYRLLTKISYEQQIVFVVRIGTHAEYSEWEL